MKLKRASFYLAVYCVAMDLPLSMVCTSSDSQLEKTIFFFYEMTPWLGMGDNIHFPLSVPGHYPAWTYARPV